MPGTAAGTGWFGTQLLDKAKSIGFTPNNFSIMPFDGGFNGGSSQVSALEGLHGLLMSHMGWDSATAYAHEGFSGMNGKSDAGEMFYQADFQHRAGLRDQPRPRPVHVLVGQPRPAVQRHAPTTACAAT